MNKKYELVDHTADLAIKVYGKDLEELLKNSSVAMMDLISNLETVKPEIKKQLVVTGQSPEQLLVNLLQEILYIHEVENLICSEAEVKVINKYEAQSNIYGEKIDLKRHVLLNDIKAVTFCDLNIKKEKNILTTRIVFDI